MQSLFRESTSLPQVAALEWRVSALVLMATVISSQGCGIISDAPNRVVSTRGVSPAESQTGNHSNDKPPTHTIPREIPPIAKIPSPPETEQATPATSQPTMMETGVASWYGQKFHGKITTIGEVFNMEKITTDHNNIPYGIRS